MYDRNRALDVIERAIDSDPFCPACQAPTTIHDEAGHLFLECSAAREPEGLFARISAAILPHIRHEIIDLSDGIAA